MKKRKTAILAFLLCAGIGLGVGYAEVNENLNITGTGKASPSDTNFVVKFAVGAPTTDAGSTGATVTATRTGDLAATFGVTGLTTRGQSVSATYTIENHSTEFKANLQSATVKNVDDNEDAYFTVTATFGSKTTLEAKSGETVDASTVTVTVTLDKTPTEEQSLSFDVEIFTEAVVL